MAGRISDFSTWCCGLARAATSPTRKKAGEHIFKALSAHLDPVFANSKFALSFDMQINDKETSWKRNNIHDALKAEASAWIRSRRNRQTCSRPIATAPPRCWRN